jgi:CBS domain-containing protein
MNASMICDAGPTLSLRAQTAADLMTPNPVSISEDLLLHEAAAFLTDMRVSGAPVINQAGAPIGVLSQTDLVIHDREKVAYAPARYDYTGEFDAVCAEPARLRNDFQVEVVGDRTTVGEVMTPTVFSVGLHTPAVRVIEEMLGLNIHRLFVTDGGGVLVGVISALDVLRHLRPTA